MIISSFRCSQVYHMPICKLITCRYANLSHAHMQTCHMPICKVVTCRYADLSHADMQTCHMPICRLVTCPCADLSHREISTDSIEIKKGCFSCKKQPLLGSEGFEPTKAEPADLQSVPFDHSGNSPIRKANSGIRTLDPEITNHVL